jgi:hypothetical protein
MWLLGVSEFVIWSWDVSVEGVAGALPLRVVLGTILEFTGEFEVFWV